jgi:hypothetical protein
MLPSYRGDVLRTSHLHCGAEALASVDSVRAEFLLNSQELVHLRDAFGACRSATLDLTSSNTNNDIGDSDIFCLARAMRHHDTPTCSVRVLCRLNGFRERTDLVDLEQQGIARLQLDRLLDTDRICDSQVIASKKSVSPL